MRISVKADLKKLNRSLSAIQKKQVPFAAMKALNDVAFDIQRTEQREVVQHIDRPTRWTKTGFRVKKASKRNLTAEVFIPPDRWRYMRYQVAGGTRGGLSNVPVQAALNAYGSMRRGYLAGRLKRKNTFSGTVRGVSGVFERLPGNRLKLIAAYESSATYTAIFPFHEIGERVARRKFIGYYRAALARALATAR